MNTNENDNLLLQQILERLVRIESKVDANLLKLQEDMDRGFVRKDAFEAVVDGLKKQMERLEQSYARFLPSIAMGISVVAAVVNILLTFFKH